MFKIRMDPRITRHAVRPPARRGAVGFIPVFISTVRERCGGALVPTPTNQLAQESSKMTKYKRIECVRGWS